MKIEDFKAELAKTGISFELVEKRFDPTYSRLPSVQRLIENRDRFTDIIVDLCLWSTTPERWSFWDKVSNGKNVPEHLTEKTSQVEPQSPATEALKFDGEKVPLDLLPFESIEEIAKVLQFGAKKYSANNWREHGGIKWGRLSGAALRHIFAWSKGEDNDPESGLSHLAHAGCCILFLLSNILNNRAEDDRFKSEV